MIPKTITREHILQSIKQINIDGYDKKNESTKYDLLYNGVRYPPKVIISLAYKFVSGSPHSVDDFSGGSESNNFLKVHGFSIVDKDGTVSGTSIQTEDDENTYTEGKEKFITHKSYERNPQLSKKKKEDVLNDQGCLKCEVCGFDFHVAYGERGYGFIECHHNKPVSEMNGSGEVNLDDLSLLCSNCHRMIHRAKPWITVEELRDKIDTQTDFQRAKKRGS
jgi:5-methylcytosine-specific restriction endonuclease McrA